MAATEEAATGAAEAAGSSRPCRYRFRRPVPLVDDARVSARVSVPISALGVLVGLLLLFSAVREYRSGASVLWPVAGAVILLCAVYTCVRDVRRLRPGQAG